MHIIVNGSCRLKVTHGWRFPWSTHVEGLKDFSRINHSQYYTSSTICQAYITNSKIRNIWDHLALGVAISTDLTVVFPPLLGAFTDFLPGVSLPAEATCTGC